LSSRLLARTRSLLGLGATAELDLRAPLGALGLDSLGISELCAVVQETTEVELGPQSLPAAAALADLLRLGGGSAPAPAPEKELPLPAAPQTSSAALLSQRMQESLRRFEAMQERGQFFYGRVISD